MSLLLQKLRSAAEIRFFSLSQSPNFGYCQSCQIKHINRRRRRERERERENDDDNTAMGSILSCISGPPSSPKCPEEHFESFVEVENYRKNVSLSISSLKTSKRAFWTKSMYIEIPIHPLDTYVPLSKVRNRNQDLMFSLRTSGLDDARFLKKSSNHARFVRYELREALLRGGVLNKIETFPNSESSSSPVQFDYSQSFVVLARNKFDESVEGALVIVEHELYRNIKGTEYRKKIYEVPHYARKVPEHLKEYDINKTPFAALVFKTLRLARYKGIDGVLFELQRRDVAMFMALHPPKCALICTDIEVGEKRNPDHVLKEIRASTPTVERDYIINGTSRLDEKFRVCEISTSSEIKKIRAFFDDESHKVDAFRYSRKERVRIWVFTSPDVNRVGKFTQNEMVQTSRKKKDGESRNSSSSSSSSSHSKKKHTRKKIRIRPKMSVITTTQKINTKRKGRKKIKISSKKSGKISPFGYSFRMKDRDNFVSLGNRAREGIDLTKTSAGFKRSKRKIEWVPSPKNGYFDDDEMKTKKRSLKSTQKVTTLKPRKRIVIRSMKNSRMSVRLEVR